MRVSETNGAAVADALPLVDTALAWCVIGKRGSGKSSFTAQVIHEYIRQETRQTFVVVDLKLGFWESLRGWGFEVARVGKPAGEQPYPWRQVLDKHPRLLVYFDQLLEEDTLPHVGALGEEVLRRGDSLLWLDEAHAFYPSPDKSAPEGLRKVVRDGRKRAVDVGFTTQMPVDIGISAIKQADVIATFRLTDQSELQRVQRYFDSREVDQLERWEYLINDQLNDRLGKGKTRKLAPA